MHRPKEEIKTSPPNCGSGVVNIDIDRRAILRHLGVTPSNNAATAGLRPCYVNGKKALFHKWVQRRELLSSSIARGGHNGGEVEFTLALVELEDGRAYLVQPQDVYFADSAGLFNQFAFDEEREAKT